MKISIVTATFNSAGTVRDTIESVLSQDYEDFEHLIVDGGSRDETLDIIREYEPRYNGRLRWLSEKDRGIYDAMNKGVMMASGEIVGILNSDDFYTSSDVLSTIAGKIGERDAVYADIHFVEDDDLTKSVRYYSSAIFRPWKMRMGFIPAHPTFYCRKKMYDDYGLYDTEFKIAADFELLLRFLYIHRISTVYIPKDLVTMRMGGASTRGFNSHRRILREHMIAYRKNGIYSNYLFEGCRYAYRIYERIVFKLGNLFHLN